MATWWHCNAKFSFLQKIPNCSAHPVCSSWTTYKKTHFRHFSRIFKKKKNQTFLNTGIPVSLSQTHYDDH